MISLTVELILFFFNVKLLIGLEKVFNYFGGWNLHPSKKDDPPTNPKKILLKSQIKNGGRLSFPPSTLDTRRSF